MPIPHVAGPRAGVLLAHTPAERIVLIPRRRAIRLTHFRQLVIEIVRKLRPRPISVHAGGEPAESIVFVRAFAVVSQAVVAVVDERTATQYVRGVPVGVVSPGRRLDVGPRGVLSGRPAKAVPGEPHLADASVDLPHG